MKIVAVIVAFTVFASSQGDDSGPDKCWMETKYWHYPGQTQAPFHTIQDCKAHCLSLENCNVIDFNPIHNPPCWIQTNNEPFVASKIWLDLANTNYYVDRKCVDGIYEDPATEEDCWFRTEKRNLFGMTRTSVNNEEDCKKECISSEGCTTFDYDTDVNPRCWINTKPVEINFAKLKIKLSSTNHILKPHCRKDTGSSKPILGIDFANVKWFVAENYRIWGLKLMITARTLEACQKQCLFFPGCNIINFIHWSKSCYINEKPFELSKNIIKPASGITTYSLDLFKTVALDEDISPANENGIVWYKSTGFKMPGLVKAKADSVEKCKGLCLTSLGCRIFDWNANSECWIQTSKLDVKFSSLKPQDSCTNYIMDFDISLRNDILSGDGILIKGKYGLKISGTEDKADSQVNTGVSIEEEKELLNNPAYATICWYFKEHIEYSDKSIFEEKSLNTQFKCVKACLDIPDCQILQFDIKSKKCLVQSKKAEIDDLKFTDHESFRAYRVDRDCEQLKA